MVHRKDAGFVSHRKRSKRSIEHRESDVKQNGACLKKGIYEGPYFQTRIEYSTFVMETHKKQGHLLAFCATRDRLFLVAHQSVAHPFAPREKGLLTCE